MVPNDDTPLSQPIRPSLSDLNPTRRFTSCAEAYRHFRPTYPPDVLDVLGEGLTSQLIVADLGAGTGISSRLLASRGWSVFAVEPNAAMRAAADPYPGVTALEGTGEATGLRAGSVDLVTCFHSFHWLDAHGALLEFARILRPRGRVGLVWNHRDRDDPFGRELSELIREKTSNHPAQDLRGMEMSLRRSEYFCGYRSNVFRHTQELDLNGLLGWMQSVSYLPIGEQRAQLLEELVHLHGRWADPNGCVRIPYACVVHLADASTEGNE
jgi:SAM-dependent methyltransferase